VRQTRVPKRAKIAFSIAFWAIVATLFIFANIEWLRSESAILSGRRSHLEALIG
jgi:hypothetical protein